MQMLEPLRATIFIAGDLYMMALIFYGLSFILRKPESIKASLRNFRAAHKPSLVNKEFKCEIYYPFISHFITQPLLILATSILLLSGLDLLPNEGLSRYVPLLLLWLQVIIALFCLDLALYIRHRFVHTFCWSYHAVHHCAQEITWLTTRRLHPVDELVMGVIDFAVLYLIGFSAEGMVIAASIKTLNNYFVHSNIVLDYPKPLKYIFVSPNMHRWHHATETQAHNKNYCVVFAFIDLAFGTYYVPDNALPESYGTSYKELDEVANKNILKELYYPFRITLRNVRNAYPRTRIIPVQKMS